MPLVRIEGPGPPAAGLAPIATSFFQFIPQVDHDRPERHRTKSGSQSPHRAKSLGCHCIPQGVGHDRYLTPDHDPPRKEYLTWYATRLWVISMDGLALGLILLVLTALYMWLQTKKIISGAISLLLGTGVAIVFLFL